MGVGVFGGNLGNLGASEKWSESAFSREFWGVLGVFFQGYLGAFQDIWWVSEKWSESAFSCEFAPSVYLKDNNQKISHNRLFPSTHYITSGGQQKG